MKLYDKLEDEKSFTGTASKVVISSNVIKDFAKDIVSGKINDNSKKIEYNERLAKYEDLLSKGRKGKNTNILREYIDKIKYALFGVNQFNLHEESKSSEATAPVVDEKQSGKGNRTKAKELKKLPLL